MKCKQTEQYSDAESEPEAEPPAPTAPPPPPTAPPPPPAAPPPVPIDENSSSDEEEEAVCLPCKEEAAAPKAGSSSDAAGSSSEEAPPVFVKFVTKAIKGKVYIHPKHGRSMYLGNSKWACPHDRERDKCKECGGSGICEHGRYRSKCKECGGKSICEHGRQRHRCKECGGTSICSHGRVRSQCKECGGSSICEHGRKRNQCKECGGTSICQHGRVRFSCKECGGVYICPHGLAPNVCKECRTADQLISSGRFCVICIAKKLGPERQLSRNGCGMCAECEPGAKVRLEHRVRAALLPLLNHTPEAVEHVQFGSDCDNQDRSHRKPDMLFSVYDDEGVLQGIVKWGCDEDSHVNTNGKTEQQHAICEGGKVGNQFEAIEELAWRQELERVKGSKLKLGDLAKRGGLARPLETREGKRRAIETGGRRQLAQFYLKCNYDAYDLKIVGWDERIRRTAERINHLLTHIRAGAPGTDRSRPNVEFWWFHSNAKFIVDHFLTNPHAVNTAVHGGD